MPSWCLDHEIIAFLRRERRNNISRDFGSPERCYHLITIPLLLQFFFYDSSFSSISYANLLDCNLSIDMFYLEKSVNYHLIRQYIAMLLASVSERLKAEFWGYGNELAISNPFPIDLHRLDSAWQDDYSSSWLLWREKMGLIKVLDQPYLFWRQVTSLHDRKTWRRDTSWQKYISILRYRIVMVVIRGVCMFGENILLFWLAISNFVFTGDKAYHKTQIASSMSVFQ